MQTMNEIRLLLEEAGLAPQKRFGQNFLIDKNLMAKLLELAEIDPSATVLEVGPGTGSLTEELLKRARRVVAVEIDRGLFGLLHRRLADYDNLALMNCDALAGKHRLAPEVLEAVGSPAVLVANLPYNVATSLVVQGLIDSWKVRAGRSGEGLSLFERQTFTVQREVADRFSAACGSDAYGPVSIVAALLARVTAGPIIPASAFWPRPQVESRMMRIDFDPASAERLADVETLSAVLSLAFGQRRKQMRSILRREGAAFPPDLLERSLEAAGIDPTIRAEQVPPEAFLAMANFLWRQK